MKTKEYTETIQHVDYESSTVKSTEYIYESKLLRVFFGNNVYEYNGVSLEDYESLRDADSQGKTLNQIIKGRYDFNKKEDLA
tara:strand:- start:153 stop:398 length:246 start_codon:yes stop_codon:yes gene_type:complete